MGAFSPTYSQQSEARSGTEHEPNCVSGYSHISIQGHPSTSLNANVSNSGVVFKGLPSTSTSIIPSPSRSMPPPPQPPLHFRHLKGNHTEETSLSQDT